MCNRVEVSSPPEELEVRFQAQLQIHFDLPHGEQNGYDRPLIPIIQNNSPKDIILSHWGLQPHWVRNGEFVLHTLNARRETIHEKVSYMHSVKNRCLILVDGIYEWQTRNQFDLPDPDGKKKKKFFIHSVDEQPIAIAGLWSINHFIDKEPYYCFTMLTKPAAGLMAEIHNKALRMPVMLDPMFERAWLMGEEVEDTIPDLVAVPV